MIALTILLRSDTNPLVFLFSVGAFLIISAFSYYFSRKGRVLRALRAEGVKKIINFSDGDKGKIIGQVVFAGETIVAPLSKRKCVFYHIIVEQYKSNGKSSSWTKLCEEEDNADVVLFDGTGYALIDAHNAMSYLVPDSNYTSSSSDFMFQYLEKILARHGHVSTDFFGFSKNLRCSEGILQDGEKFVVAGEGQWNKTKDHNLNIPTANVLVIVPGKKENIYVSDDPEATDPPQNEQ